MLYLSWHALLHALLQEWAMAEDELRIGLELGGPGVSDDVHELSCLKLAGPGACAYVIPPPIVDEQAFRARHQEHTTPK